MRRTGSDGRAPRAAPCAGGRAVAAAVAVAVVAGALAACGTDDGDAGGGTTSEPGDAAPPAEASLTVQVDRVGESLRIGWRVTNDGDADLVLFDGRRADDDADTDLPGAYVTAGRDGEVEISRRLFPVPEGVEVDGGVPGTLGVRLPPGGEAGGRDLVVLPPGYLPAAPEGGGRPPSGDATSAVFCVGVGPLADLEARPAVDDPDRYFVAHNEANAGRQTLLCGDPVEL